MSSGSAGSSSSGGMKGGMGSGSAGSSKRDGGGVCECLPTSTNPHCGASPGARCDFTGTRDCRPGLACVQDPKVHTPQGTCIVPTSTMTCAEVPTSLARCWGESDVVTYRCRSEIPRK